MPKAIITIHDNYIKYCYQKLGERNCMSKKLFMAYYKRTKNKFINETICGDIRQNTVDSKKREHSNNIKLLFVIITILFNVRCTDNKTTIMPRHDYDNLILSTNIFGNTNKIWDSNYDNYDLKNIMSILGKKNNMKENILSIDDDLKEIISYILVYFLVERLRLLPEDNKTSVIESIRNFAGNLIDIIIPSQDKLYKMSEITVDGVDFSNCADITLYNLLFISNKLDEIKIETKQTVDSDYKADGKQTTHLLYNDNFKIDGKFDAVGWSLYLSNIPYGFIFNKGKYELQTVYLSKVLLYLLDNKKSIEETKFNKNMILKEINNKLPVVLQKYELEIYPGHAEVIKKLLFPKFNIHINKMFELLTLCSKCAPNDVVNEITMKIFANKFTLVKGNTQSDINKKIEESPKGNLCVLHECEQYSDGKLILGSDSDGKLILGSDSDGKLILGSDNVAILILFKAFYNNHNITNIDMKENVMYIGDSAFENCSNLSRTLRIPNSVMCIGNGAFKDCSNITELEIEVGVTSIGDGAFMGCFGIIGLTIPNSVKSIGDNAFSGCTSITGHLTIPNSVKSIGDNAFSGCTSITGHLTIPNSVTSIGNGVFAECRTITGLTIPNSVTSIGVNAFKNCIGINESLTIPNSVTNIGENAFASCIGIRGPLTIPNSVRSIGNSAFHGCQNINGPLILSNNLTSIGDSVFEDCKNINGPLIIPDSVMSIGNYAFNNCIGINGSLTIPNSVTSIGNNAFNSCTHIIGHLTIPNSIKRIGEGTFENCRSITGLTIPDSVTRIGDSAFAECRSISGHLTIPNSIKRIDEGTFENCRSITGLTIPDSVTRIGDSAFAECRSISGHLTIPNSVKSIGVCAFEKCRSITGLTIPDSVTSIDNLAFMDCSGITGPLIIPGSVTSIGNNAFSGCSGITGPVIISNSDTSIGNNAFSGCSGITGPVIISNSDTSIGDNVFPEGLDVTYMIN
jgi:hypothetical protein